MRGWRLIAATAVALGGCGSPQAPGNGAAPAGNEAAPAAQVVAPPPPANAIPPAFHGVYDSSRDACSRPSEYRLTVSARELRFHESIGTIRRVTVEGPDAIRVEADYQGEGESWRATHALRLADRGAALAIAGEGTSLTRVRCGPAAPVPAAETLTWGSEGSSGGHAALVLVGADGKRRLSLSCRLGSDELVVNVPGFRPVGSEERMSFGAGGTVVTLVADPRGDARRGGVSGRGPIPAELAAILAAPEGIAVNYGAQNGGPYPTPPARHANDFLAECPG